MEENWTHLTGIAVTVVTTALFTLIGFVWKISHRVSALEKMLEAHKNMTRREISSVEKDVEIIYNNVDKNREWTTSRMMSIVKELPK